MLISAPLPPNPHRNLLPSDNALFHVWKKKTKKKGGKKINIWFQYAREPIDTLPFSARPPPLRLRPTVNRSNGGWLPGGQGAAGAANEAADESEGREKAPKVGGTSTFPSRSRPPGGGEEGPSGTPRSSKTKEGQTRRRGGRRIISRAAAKFMTSNIPNYTAVKDLINCGVHEGRTGEEEEGGGRRGRGGG